MNKNKNFIFFSYLLVITMVDYNRITNNFIVHIHVVKYLNSIIFFSCDFQYRRVGNVLVRVALRFCVH